MKIMPNAGAHDGLAGAENVPGDAEARRHVVVVRRIGLADSVADLHESQRRIKIGEKIVLFLDREGDVVAHAEVDRDARRDAEIVLREEAERFDADVARGLAELKAPVSTLPVRKSVRLSKSTRPRP